ncbi:MAG: O-antigen ligase family protein, partial [Candidatus Margulisiibacteriota bacterium]
MTEKYSKQIDLALEVVFLCLLFVSPLFFDRSIGIVFSLSKATLIRSFSVLIIALWISRVALTGQIKLVKTIADLPLLTYLLSAAVATLLSINVYVSFAGSYGRYEGFITLLNYVLLFFIAANIVTSVEKLKKIMVCAAISGALMSVYGIIQRMGIDPFIWGGVITNERVISTIGQPNFLAAYLDMSFVLGIGFILFSGRRHSQFIKADDIPQRGKKTKAKKQKSVVNWDEIIYQAKVFCAFPLSLLLFVYMIFNIDGITAPLLWTFTFISIFALLIYFTLNSAEMDSRILKAVIALSILLDFIAILFTQSRGGLLGFLCGVVLIFVFAGRSVVFEKWKELWKELTVIALILLATVFCMFAFTKFSPMNRINQEVNISASQTGTKIEFKSAAGSRLETWKSAFKLLVDRPILGVGPEVLKMIFPQYETQNFRFKEGFHVKQDRCHNEILDTAVTKGSLTLFAYIWFLAFVFKAGAKKIKAAGEAGLLTLSFLGAIFAYMVQNQFSFGVVAIGALFWVMLGAVAGMSSGSFYELSFNKDGANKTPRVLFLIVVWIIAAVLALLSFLPYVADMHYKAAKILSDSNFERAAAEHELSLKLSPFEGGYYTNYGITLLNYVSTDKAKSGEMIKALAVLDRGSRVDPYNADNYYMIG